MNINDIKNEIGKLEQEYKRLHEETKDDLVGNNYEERARKIDADLARLEGQLRIAEIEQRASRIAPIPIAPLIEDAESKTADDDKLELKGFFEGKGPEKKVMSLGTDSGGGAASATAQFINELMSIAAKDSFALANCSVYTVDGAKAGDLPVLTAERAQASWVAESTNDTAADPGFARKTLTLYAARATTAMTRQLLEQSMINIEAEIAAQLGRSIAYLVDSFLIDGTGSSQPLGIKTDSANGVPSSQKVTGSTIATTVSVDNLVDVMHKVRPPYWRDSVWLISSGTLASIRKLKDTNSRPLITEVLTSQGVPSLLGRPLFVSEYVAAPAANAVCAYFGDFSKYAVARGGDITLIVDPYSSALKAEIYYHAFQMLGGSPGVGEAFAKLACPAT